VLTYRLAGRWRLRRRRRETSFRLGPARDQVHPLKTRKACEVGVSRVDLRFVRDSKTRQVGIGGQVVGRTDPLEQAEQDLSMVRRRFDEPSVGLSDPAPYVRSRLGNME